MAHISIIYATEIAAFKMFFYGNSISSIVT